MEVGGEADVRGAYCALAVSRLLGLDINEAYAPVAGFLARCQTYQGGFGGCPGMEAHGGYSFCAFAAMVMLKKEHLVDVDALLHWAVNRQMRLEGGFQGRTNKLVDGCYSFWVGGIFPLLHGVLLARGEKSSDLLCSRLALQSYVLVCCQMAVGGLLDKPGKRRDYYHSCYTLSGVSVLQHYPHSAELGPFDDKVVFGHASNLLQPTHPVFNIRMDKVSGALEYFDVLKPPT